MKTQGIIQVWQDERGFGFIEFASNKKRVFFHIKDFRAKKGLRPEVGEQVVFRVIKDSQGRYVAADVKPLKPSLRYTPVNNRPWGWLPDVLILVAYLLAPWMIFFTGKASLNVSLYWCAWMLPMSFLHLSAIGLISAKR